MDYTAVTGESALIALLVVPLIWVLISYVIYRFGWRDMQLVYPADPGIITKRVGTVSGVIGKSTYTNALVLRYNSDGIELRPFVLSRLFAKPVFIPWKDLQEGARTDSFFFKRRELVLGKPEYGRIVMSPSRFTEFEDYLSIYAAPTQRSHRQSTTV